MSTLITKKLRTISRKSIFWNLRADSAHLTSVCSVATTLVFNEIISSRVSIICEIQLLHRVVLRVHTSVTYSSRLAIWKNSIAGSVAELNIRHRQKFCASEIRKKDKCNCKFKKIESATKTQSL